MKTLAQLDQLNLDADTKTQVTDLVQMLLEQSQKEVRSQQLTIQSLTMELAYLRRIQFGKKSESLSSKQLSLFEETLLSDLAGVNTEIEQLDPSTKANLAKPPRVRAGRQPLPDHLPRIEHRHEPKSCRCDQCGHHRGHPASATAIIATSARCASSAKPISQARRLIVAST